MAVVLAATAAQLHVGVTDQGMIWPDEIHQSLEQAHRLVFGVGALPWEFDVGVRSWLFPGILAGLLKLGAWLGREEARFPVLAARAFMALTSGLTVWLTMRLSLRIGGKLGALWTGLLLATLPLWLLFGSRCMSEVASTPLLVAAALLAVDQRSSGARVALAGVLAAAASVIRPQNVIALIGVLALLGRGGPSPTRARFLDGAVVATVLLGGALDWATWGAPFHSGIAYVRFNFFEDGSSRFGVEPWTFYASTLFRSTGIGLVSLAVLPLFSPAPARWLLATVVLYVTLHSIIPHKELRFLFPVLPLMLAAAGAGAAALAAKIGGRRGVLAISFLVAITAIANAVHTRSLKIRDLGYAKDANQSVWHIRESYNRLLWLAGDQGDLCGLAVLGVNPVYTGAYSYLHRSVPLYYVPSITSTTIRAANFILVPAGVRPGADHQYGLVGRHQDLELLSRKGTCSPPQDDYLLYFWP
jgi:phosphatidylinositol glycan class B